MGSSYDEVVPFVQQVPYPTAASVQMILDEQAEKNPKAKTARAADFFDASILKALEAEGFFKKLLGF